MASLDEALTKLDAAITNPGPRPDYHHAQINRLKQEWPTLWTAIEQVRAAHADNHRR